MSQDLINAVLIALDEDTMLLPNIAVAEVLPIDRLDKQGEGMAALAGHVTWEGRRVPVVNFEVLNGAPQRSEFSKRGRISLLHSIGTHGMSTVGLVTHGHPHLVTLNREAVQPGEFRVSDRSDLVLARVRISSHEALVPDFDTLGREVLRLQDPAAQIH